MPVLFIMAEKNAYADAIGEYLWKTKEFGFKEAEVLVIHTDSAGEITKKDTSRRRARRPATSTSPRTRSRRSSA